MTQATAPGRPAAPVQRPPTAPASTGRAVPVIAGRSIPATLVRLRAATAALCALVAALAAVLLVLGWQANRAAAADTEQLIRAQGIETNLLAADALATNAFLVGGLEPPEHRAAYDAAVDAAAREHRRRRRGPARRPPGARRAQHRGPALRLDDGARPGQQPPRAAGRRGIPPVGEQGPAGHRAPARRGARHGQRRPGPRPRWAASTPGSSSCAALLVLVVLGLVNQWVARRFRRRVNLGLAGAAAAVVLLAAGGVATAASVAGSNTTVRTTSYATVVERGRGPDGGQRRQVRREPAAHRPRLRQGVRGRLGRRRQSRRPAPAAAAKRLHGGPRAGLGCVRARTTSRSSRSTTAASGTRP